MKERVSTISRQQERNILVRLKDVQAKSGYISPADIAEIAKSYDTSISEVYGVATFYSFLCVTPPGRNVIRICRSLPCHLKEGDAVRKQVSEILGIGPGETTADGRFTLEVTNCIGACDMAPAMLVNGDLHGNLTPQNIADTLESYR